MIRHASKGTISFVIYAILQVHIIHFGSLLDALNFTLILSFPFF